MRSAAVIRRLLDVALVAALLALAIAGALAWTSGIRPYSVDSDSMRPAFRAGDLLIDTPVTSTTALVTGDIVTFHPTADYTATHRIVAITPAGITTRGDANASDDVGQISPSAVVGRVAFIIPFGGAVLAAARSPIVLGCVLALLVGVPLVGAVRRGSTRASRRTES